MKHFLFCSFLSIGVLSLPVAQAQPDEDPLKQAEEEFNEAESYYALGEWANALEHYKKSFLLSKEPMLLFNIAQCQRQLGQYADAKRSYRNFITQTNLPEQDPQRVTAEKLLAEVEKLIASKPEPTTQPQPTTSSNKPDPIKPAPEPVAPKETPNPVAKAAPLWAASGASAVLFAVGGLRAKAKVSELEDLHQDPKATQAKFDEIAKKAKNNALLSDLSLLAAVGTAAGGALVFVSTKAKAEIALTLTGASLSVHY